MQARAVVGVADIHARPLAHGVEALEDLDRIPRRSRMRRRVLRAGSAMRIASNRDAKSARESALGLTRKTGAVQRKVGPLICCSRDDISRSDGSKTARKSPPQRAERALAPSSFALDFRRRSVRNPRFDAAEIGRICRCSGIGCCEQGNQTGSGRGRSRESAWQSSRARQPTFPRARCHPAGDRWPAADSCDFVPPARWQTLHASGPLREAIAFGASVLVLWRRLIVASIK